MALSNGSGLVNGNAQNIPEAHVPRNHSSFPLRAIRANTERYGEYTPIFAMESIKGDALPFRVANQLLSYTMRKPLMQNVSKVQDLFSVPMEAILPFNWEKFFDQPVRGDDVNSDVGPSLEHFWSRVAELMNTQWSNLEVILDPSSTNTDSDALTAFMRFIVLGEFFYSNGSLMSSLGCHGAPYCSVTGVNGMSSYIGSFDEFVDDVCGRIFDPSISKHVNRCIFMSDGDQYNYNVLYTDYNRGNVPIKHMLSLLRDDLTGYFLSVSLNDNTSVKAFLKSIYDRFTFNFVTSTIPFNTQFLWAYQLVCAHYYTNDHVDFIYSAELFRQLINNYNRYFYTQDMFVRNGFEYQYDYLSAHYLGEALTAASLDLFLLIASSASNHPNTFALLGYFSALFSYRRSLRYMDYFSGARTQPLAVGSPLSGSPSSTSVSVDVNSNSVSVIDITRSIQAQRFLNSVNRIGHQFEKYLKGIFGGGMPAPDYHNPFHLASTTDTVFSDETQNTADSQFQYDISITTNMRGNSSNYMFEVNPDRPSVLIVISYYDVHRLHMKTMDRAFLHLDRYDYFNPFTQYVGDQPVFQAELGEQPAIGNQNFAYTIRHMEYKQLFSSASGGFVQYLPGFVFPALDKRGSSTTISPEYIRCVPSEIDQFYVSLTGFSLASYFHFIVKYDLDLSGSRPMAYSPQILG